MTSFVFTDPDGVKHRVTGPDGATEAEAFQILQGQLGSSSTPSLADAAVPAAPLADEALPSIDGSTAPSPKRGILDSVGDKLGTAGKFIKGTLGDLFGDAQDDTGAQVGRGVGLATRSVGGAIPKTTAGIADLGSTVLNFGIEGIDKAGQALGDEPLDFRFGADNTQNLDQLMNRFLPEPEGFVERAADLGGNALFTGGAGMAALAPRTASTAPSVEAMLAGPAAQGLKTFAPKGSVKPQFKSLADEIGASFATSPKAVAAQEFGAGAGASIAGDLANEADASPAQRLLATVAGGLGGGITPAVVSRPASAAFSGLKRAAEPLSTEGTATRAARALQSQAKDPKAAAKAAREADAGVSPARASGDENLLAMERKVLDESPQKSRRVTEGLDSAEQTAMGDLTKDLPPGRDPTEWQQEVITRGAPDNAEIRIGEPSEMIDDAYKGFKTAYKESEGFPVTTRDFDNNVPLSDLFDGATNSSTIIADDSWRAGVSKFLNGLLDDVSGKRGVQVGAADSTVFKMDSKDLLDLRHSIRTKLRSKTRAGALNERAAAEAEMLREADRAITLTLESQLPPKQLAHLKATDLRYRDYKVVEDAVVRAGEKGLTPETLRAAVKASSSKGDVARGQTGDLGTLAASGKDLTKLMGKGRSEDAQIRRAVSAMDDTTAASARADMVRKIAKQSHIEPRDGHRVISGTKLQRHLDDNRASFEAAGVTPAEIKRIERIAKRLTTIQSKTPLPATKLIDDNLSALTGFMARVSGLKVAKKIVTLTGGGPVLAITSFASRQAEKVFRDFSFGDANKLIEEALFGNPELFDSLMLRSTAGPVAQAKANRVLKAWIAQTGTTDDEDE